MKKLLLFTSILFFAFSSSLNAQTIDSVIVTDPIVCYGDFASATCYIAQTTPTPTQVQYRNYRFASPTFLMAEGSSNQQVLPTFTVGSLIAGPKRMILVDSTDFAIATAGMGIAAQSAYVIANTNPAVYPVLDFKDYEVFGVPVLTAILTQTVINLCDGDCIAELNVLANGGSFPYNIGFSDGVTTTTADLAGFDTTYTDLCAGTYDIILTDINGCQTSPPATPFTITAPTPLTPDGSVTSDYNGQQISCVGASDGEITAVVTGGTGPYTYAIDTLGIGVISAFQVSPIFPGLPAGSYIIYYKDFNLCDTSETITLVDPPALSGTLSITKPISCGGYTDGAITFLVDAINTGTPGYTYLWNDPLSQTTATAIDLGIGIYTCIVTDLNGCSDSAFITITEPSELFFTAFATQFYGSPDFFGVSCFGAEDGEIQIDALTLTGGTPPYQFACDTTPPPIYSSWLIYQDLKPDTFTVTVRDTLGCEKDTAIILTEPPLFTITATVSDSVSCFGDCDGEVTVIPTNGNGGIVYAMAPFLDQITTVWDSICGDSLYTIIATDTNGCIDSTTITLLDPALLMPNGGVTSDYNGQQISCVGASNGQITAVVTGGTTSYTYAIDTLGVGIISAYQVNPIFDNLPAGSYIIYYKDFHDCDTSETITLTDPDSLLGTLTIIDSVSCNGVADGSIRFSVDGVNGGTPGYTYSINGGPFQSDSTFTGLLGGQMYTVTVQDTNGCKYTDSIFLSDPTVIVFTATSTVFFPSFGVSCNGETDGKITIGMPTGGTPPFQYSFDGGAYSSINADSNLAAGTYTVSVRDTNGCIETTTVTLTEPVVFSITASATSPVSCADTCDGEVTVDNGGTGNGGIIYTMTSFLPQTTTVWDSVCGNLSFGTYTINAVDTNGCPATTSIALAEADPWVYTMDSTAEVCHFSNGEASINITQGGTGTITYLWSTGSTNDSIFSLDWGMYSVTVTDFAGCSFSDSIFVDTLNITLDFTIVPPCNTNDNGSATVIPNGTPGYTYDWTIGGPAANTNTITDLTPGWYVVSVVDTNLCIITDSVEIPQGDTVTLALDTTMIQDTLVTCFGDPSSEITVIATGGTGFNTYKYYIPLFYPTPQVPNTFYGLYANEYVIYGFDFNGCSDSVVVTISEPDELIFTISKQDVGCFGDSTGIAYIDPISGGTPPYSYLWSTGDTTDIISNLSAGTFWVQVTDSLGCPLNVIADTIIINEPPVLESVITIVSHATCDSSALATGEMNVVASGGAPGLIIDYTYLWSPGGSTSASINFLMPGEHIVEITDSNGCTILDTAEILPGTNPNLVTVIEDVSCFGAADGTVTPSAVGGTAPYQFSIDGGVTFDPPGTVFGPYGPTAFFLTVIDTNGCVDADSVYVTEPTLLEIDSINIQIVSCYDSADGELEVIFSGGTPGYSYLWSNGDITQTADTLIAGTYTITVTDTNGCFDVSSATVSEPDQLIFTSLFEDVGCYGDSTGIAYIDTIYGGTAPYSYLWSTGEITDSISNLPADTFWVQAMDSLGCLSTPITDTIIINEPDSLQGAITVLSNATCDSNQTLATGQITIVASGGAPGTITDYSYQWYDGLGVAIIGEKNDTISNLMPGMYTVEITDSNGCTVSDTAEILTGTNPDLSVTILEPSCFGDADGELTSSATLGTAPYQFSIDAGLFQSDSMFTGLSAGTYFITVQDTLGCTDSDSIIVANPNIVNIALDTTMTQDTLVTCFGDPSNGITVIATGGTGFATYLYNIPLVPPATLQASGTFTGLYAGAYTIYAIDNNGCPDSVVVTISEPDSLMFTTSFQHLGCFGDSSGIAYVDSISGGTAPYSYFWNTGETTDSISNLPADTFWVQVADSLGCPLNIISDTMIITEPPVLESVITIVSHATCDSSQTLATGEINVVASGGAPGTIIDYTYLWSPGGSTSATDSLLLPGEYIVEITDSNGCTILDTAEILPGTNPTLAAVIQDVSCFTAADGTITSFATGGTAPYQFSIDGGVTYDPSGTVFGPYGPIGFYMTVVDSLGCSDADSVYVSEPALLAIDSINIQIVSCFDSADGELEVIFSGGTPGYSYLWSNGDITQTADTLIAGTYTVTVTDTNGCSDSSFATVIEPGQIIFTSLFEDVGCNGDSTGIAYIDTIYGGTAPYSYLWSTGEITDSISNLQADTFWVQPMDSLGCLSTPSKLICCTDTIIINEPPVLQSIITVLSNATCDSNQTLATGEITVVASGGAPGTIIDYTYMWSDTVPTINDTISSLMPGMYTVEITDSNGCTVLDSAEILTGTNPDLYLSAEHVSCFGGGDGTASIDSIAGGTAPFTYLWGTGDTTNMIDSLIIGVYSITVQDTLGCTDTDSIQVTEPHLLVAALVNNQNVSCYDSSNGSLSATVIGGTLPYSYLWSNGDTNQTTNNLIAGFYSVIVTDAKDCSATDTMEITQPDSLYISALTFTAVLCHGQSNGTASVVAAGGTPGYSYLWSTGDTTDMSSNLPTGTYSVTITDTNGCIRNSSIFVTEPDALTTDSIFQDSLTCFGANNFGGPDGSATVIVSGGVLPYTYLWDNGDTNQIANNLQAIYYGVTITDSNGCPLIDSIEVLGPSYSIEIDTSIVDSMICHDGNNASITVVATSGLAPYMYSNNNALTLQSTYGFNSLAAATYIMYVEDALGCVDRDTIVVANADSLYIDTVIFSNVTCYGANDAYISAITAVNGTTPYEYSVNGGAHHPNLSNFNGYGPGNYTVAVFDSNNCSNAYPIIITEPTELDVTIDVSNYYSYQIACNGDSSGTATIVATGGLGFYIYTVTNILGDTVVSSSSPNITNLIAGIYTFWVQDANGCLYEETIIYNEPDVITHNFIATHVSCSGWNNGSLTDIISGGVGTATTYTYSWNTGATGYSLTSLGVGTYTDTVVDMNDCISIASYTINASDSLSLTATGTNVTCWDYCDGVIITNVTGGLPNLNASGLPVYSYQWDDAPLFQTTATAIGLCTDNTSNSTTYMCIVEDGQGCTDTIWYDLMQPDSLDVIISVSQEIACHGEEGALIATTTGGNVGGMTYLWNNSIATATNNGLTAGSYVIIVEDVNGCPDTAQFYLSEPDALSIEVNILNNETCFGDEDGRIKADATGGTVIGIQEYIYTWSNGFNEQIDISTATGLSPGVYTVTAVDDNGCPITSQSVIITGADSPLSISVDSTDEICGNDGLATSFVLGGTQPYIYAWSDNVGNPLATGNPLINLGPGLYNIDVRDANGCEVSGSTFVNGIQNIFLPENNSSIDSNICLGASVSLPIQVKPTLSYLWMYNNDTIYSANANDYSQVTVTPTEPINVYTLYITDPSCLTYYTVTATINVEPVDPLPSTNPLPENGAYPTIVKGESIEIFSENMNCDIYTWTWINGSSSTRSISDNPVESGWYYIEVDLAGCLGFDSIYVVVGVKPYDAITPNGDGFNDVWNLEDIVSYPNALIQIFNRWGALVHETSGGFSYVAWDGTSNGEELPVGTYYYIIDLKTNDEPQSGPITIIR